MTAPPDRRHHGTVPDSPTPVVATLPGPWGPIHAAATDRGIVAIATLAPREAFEAGLAHLVGAQDSAAAGRLARQHLDQLASQLAAYFDGGEEAFSVPLDLRVGSAWDRLVLDGVGAIPYGNVASYGEVAARIGRFGAARAVGGAVGRNPIAILVPCHRVIAARGALGGYGGDWYGSREERLAMKRDLLRLEGVVLRDDPTAPRSRRERVGEPQDVSDPHDVGEALSGRTILVGAA
jgi:O-6-methylguanine DNA methyltransferase